MKITYSLLSLLLLSSSFACSASYEKEQQDFNLDTVFGQTTQTLTEDQKKQILEQNSPSQLFLTIDGDAKRLEELSKFGCPRTPDASVAKAEAEAQAKLNEIAARSLSPSFPQVQVLHIAVLSSKSNN